MTTIANETNATPVVVTGAEVFIPLNKLKKHPNNARKTLHSEASIEAKAASIHAKGILQNLVVEPELNAEGAATGFYLVSIGEGRRLAQLLRVKRKQIKKTEPILRDLFTEDRGGFYEDAALLDRLVIEKLEGIGALKMTEMADAAERLLAGTGWLPAIMRTARPAWLDDRQDGDAFLPSDTKKPVARCSPRDRLTSTFR